MPKTKTIKSNMVYEKFPAFFLFGLIAFVLWYLFQVFNPFLLVLIFSAIVVAVTYPIYAYFEKLFRHRKRIASLVTCLLVIFAIVIPVLIFLIVLARQAVNLYVMTNQLLHQMDFNALMKWQHGNFFYDILGNYHNQVGEYVKQNTQNLSQAVTDLAKYISTFAATLSTRILTSLGLALFNLFLMFFTMYFLYKDGEAFTDKLMLISPIPGKYKKELFRKFREISKATLVGTFLTAIAQGLVAWIGFIIAGVPNSFFWATAVTIFSLVPVVGTALIWVPIGVTLLITGNIFGGVFVLLWGVGVVSTVDNLLRVVFIGTISNLNPLLTFITVFGGIAAFGLVGVILGPMLLVLFLTLLHIYELEYAPILDRD